MKISILITLCFLIIWLGWRYASRLKSIPCPSYLSWLIEIDNPFSKINQAKVIIENSLILPGMTILDAGCGPGRVTIPIAKATGPNGKVIAMDMQTSMLSKVQKKAEKENLNNIEYLHAGLGEGKLTANHFDRALLVTVLGEIPDEKRALQEIFKSLKPNGIISITETIFDPHYQSIGSIIPLATSIGFKEKLKIGNSIAFTLLLEKKG